MFIYMKCMYILYHMYVERTYRAEIARTVYAVYVLYSSLRTVLHIT
jgi:predicted transcriptional regulator with HTH domain